MSYNIIIGRDISDKEKFGEKGLINIGRGYVHMGQHTSLSNNLLMDIARSHVVLIAGKRGSGKSYTLATIAEEISTLPAENAKNIASVIFDTMGIFWTMKYKNEKDVQLLKQWNLEAKNIPLRVFVPVGKASVYHSKDIPFDSTFAIKVEELEAEDWLSIFNLKLTNPLGVLITRVIAILKKNFRPFTLIDIQKTIEKDHHSPAEIKENALAFFTAAESWGIFAQEQEGTAIADLTIPGTTTVLDISVYSAVSAFNIRALVIALIARKIFNSRMDARKKEEINAIRHGQEYLSYQSSRDLPLVWLFIDEGHEFLPKEGKTPATDALIQVLREGRQPGLSLVIATQQPGQIHKDVMTQADIVISHRVTAKPDIEALNEIMQTYLLEDIRQHLDALPAVKGSAIILDDNSERIYPMRIRPRFTWHGGEAPASISAEVKL